MDTEVCEDVALRGGHAVDCPEDDCPATDGECCEHCHWVPADSVPTLCT